MPTYKLIEIAEITGGTLKGNANENIRHLVIDSRTHFSAAGSLFFALKGERHNGHKYIEELYYRKGLKNFVVQHIDEQFESIEDINFIVVSDVLAAMHALTAFHRSKFNAPVIAVTGSNGKTIVKEWLFQLMHTQKPIIRSPKSYNSQTGVPLSVWNLEKNAELAIIEAGISKPGEMLKLQAIIKPDIGILTNIGSAHQENFLSLQRKTREKLVLFRETPVLIYCSDHVFIEDEMADWVNPGQTLLTWSNKHAASLQVKEVNSVNGQTNIVAIYNNQECAITIPFTDGASVENAIHCWLTMLHLGFDNAYIALGMKNLSPVAMRLELKKGINGCTIINDSYNSDFHSLAIALDFLNQQQQHTAKTLILSDILQSGKTEEQLYKQVARLVADKKVDRIIGIGPVIFANALLFNCKKEFYRSTDEFIKQMQASWFVNEAILLKGARVFGFEQISQLLEQKTHQTILEINLSAMVHNLNYFRSKLKPTTKITAMVKAFSYGSGSYEIANMLEYQKVDYLAVAFADEGEALRKAGIRTPIMVMNPDENSFRQIVENNLEPEIFGFTILNAFISFLLTNQIEAYPVHIKLDTGMHRLGFTSNEAKKLEALLTGSGNTILVKSVFSHLAASDEPVHDAFTHEQAKRFESFCQKISGLNNASVDKHLLNSMGIERFPQYQYNMVRLGIGLYGIDPFNQHLLQCVSTLKTTILQIKEVAPGETIGYSRKGVAPNGCKVAIIPIGYADGFSRSLGNGKGEVFIAGKRVPIIGNICMDMCMADITGINVKEGDAVEIFGSNISINELAKNMQTIPYEVLTGIAQRVKRQYVQE